VRPDNTSLLYPSLLSLIELPGALFVNLYCMLYPRTLRLPFVRRIVRLYVLKGSYPSSPIGNSPIGSLHNHPEETSILVLSTVIESVSVPS